MTFRRRILIAMVPLFVLLVALGTTGTFLIYHLGDQVGKILRENYDSVIFMRDLNEALERIDSSFQFALAGREEQSLKQYQENWKKYQECLDREQHNITVPGEKELDDRLNRSPKRTMTWATLFIRASGGRSQTLYFGKDKDRRQRPGPRQGPEEGAVRDHFRRSRPFPATSSG